MVLRTEVSTTANFPSQDARPLSLRFQLVEASPRIGRGGSFWRENQEEESSDRRFARGYTIPKLAGSLNGETVRTSSVLDLRPVFQEVLLALVGQGMFDELFEDLEGHGRDISAKLGRVHYVQRVPQ
jgi:hypothetical protein